jgi:hypothetical protein
VEDNLVNESYEKEGDNLFAEDFEELLKNDFEINNAQEINDDEAGFNQNQSSTIDFENNTPQENYWVILDQIGQIKENQAQIDAFQEMHNKKLSMIEKNLDFLQMICMQQNQAFEASLEEQKNIKSILQMQQEKQILKDKKDQKDQLAIHDAYQKPLKNFIIELQNIHQKSKTIYYKPFLIHGLFFLIMTCLITFFLSMYINEIKRQRELNQQELVLIQQSKKGQFSQCGEGSELCVKIQKQKFYGESGEYAIIDLQK